MRILFSLMAVLALLLLAWVGTGVIDVPFTHWLFGTGLPWAAAFTFVVGFVWRVLDWAKVPVPFRIPTAWVALETLEIPAPGASNLQLTHFPRRGNLLLQIFNVGLASREDICGRTGFA